MAPHRDRRHGAAPASPWKSIVAAIGLLYVLFLVRVNVWTASTAEPRANAVGGGGDGASHAVHAKDALLVHSERDLHDTRYGAATTGPPKPQLRTALELPAPSPSATAASMKMTALEALKPLATTEQAKVPDDARVPTEPMRASATTAAAAVAVEEEKAAHDHDTDDGIDNEAPIHLAVAATPSPMAGASTQLASTPSSTSASSFESRHDIIAGYEQTQEYLQNYKKDPSASASEGLFLFFTCSDDDGKMHDWSTLCTEARAKVYDVFAKSPLGNRLVTIRAGSEEFWEYRNAFSNDRDLRVKSVPCLMKWEGRRGETSGMLVGSSLLYDPFLRYLFKNVDKPDAFISPDAMHSKHIITLTSRRDYDAYMSAYRRETSRPPLFLFFVSGRIEDNKRPWCPYCRYSELPAEYGFYAFAPAHARLVRIEVTPTYKEWKQPNEFNTDPVLGLRGVPAFFRIRSAPGSNDDVVYERIIERFDLLETWRSIYDSAKV